MKLTIKELAPYLPYDLILYDEFDIKNHKRLIGFKNKEVIIASLPRYPYSFELGINNLKPIFHPLSDLTKEIEHNGEIFIPLDKIQELYPSISGIKMIDYEVKSGLWMLNTNRDGEVSINIMRQIDDKLCEWHFDHRFNLIENGLAIDINTL